MPRIFQMNDLYLSNSKCDSPDARGNGVALVSRIDKIIGLFCKEAYKRDDILHKRPVI